MKTKFWSIYLLGMFLLLGGVYWATAGMSDVPLALSDTQMEQLSGALIDWNCVWVPPCNEIPCNNNTNQWVLPWSSTCYTCETDPNNTCYYLGYYCHVCQVRIYPELGCPGFQYEYYLESWNKCE